MHDFMQTCFGGKQPQAMQLVSKVLGLGWYRSVFVCISCNPVTTLLEVRTQVLHLHDPHPLAYPPHPSAVEGRVKQQDQHAGMQDKAD
jgi:hypothetical protein